MTEAEAIQALRALAQPTRWRLLDMLLRAEPEAVPVNTVAEELDLLQNSASTHLGILQRVGLVASHRLGRQIFYRAERERLQVLAQTIEALATHR